MGKRKSPTHKQFGVIEADPAWKYRTWTDSGNGIATRHYGLMERDSIASLPVERLAAPDCVLFLWGTYPLLPEVLAAGASWGFEYITLAFNWIKRNRDTNSWFMGNGHYTRANSEPCFIFKRGNPPPPAVRNIRQIISDQAPDEFTGVQPGLWDNSWESFQEFTVVTNIMKHSVKPLAVYEAIELMYPELNKIRLFARERRAGWVSIGNEITGNDLATDIYRITVPFERPCFWADTEDKYRD